MKASFECIFVALVAIAACTAHRKPQYELPQTMLPHVRAEYGKQCDTGQRLYAMNCADCHNVKVGRKMLIPDFREEELRGYALRVANARHEENMPDSLVSEEDLGMIMTFLRYKKQTGIERQVR